VVIKNNGRKTCSAKNVVVIGEVCLAHLASIDLATSEVDIICETHSGWFGG
jgi:sialic acid synthase SpsE